MTLDTATTIRPIRPTEVGPVADLRRRNDFGDREGFLAWSLDRPTITAFVATAGDAIVGTGVASAHGNAGWVGMIFVAEERRGAGIGTAITQATIDDLERRGCRTQVLIASPLGRPIYERLGFAEIGRQVRFSSGRQVGDGSADPRIRRFEVGDLDAVLAIDRAATGEDRREVLRHLLEPATTWVTRDGTDRPTGYYLRPPWRGGAVVAPDPGDGLRLLELRRHLAGSSDHAGAGLFAVNGTGRRRLREAGWHEEAGNVRMARGEPLDWNPIAIWGYLIGALG
jgi:GNAT superfamily N-acetyltransferase